jgi:GTPase-associated protein 1, N-terminal domain type 2/GTPase-associated protein 1, middle domain
MNAELLYTSAPQGLKQGSRGFCTVLSTVGMPLNIATKLESLSGYRHLYPSGTPDAAKNPVSYSHLKLSVGGRMISVISRISDYGLDYSQRTNKLAHHIVVDAPLPNCGPAALLADPSVMRTQWDGNCINVPAPPALSATSADPAPCSTWEAITGDAGWGGVLANAWLNPASKPIFVVFSEDQSVQVLSLIEEAISLLHPSKRWQATFGTYVTNLPPDVDCKVRCVVSGSEEARMASARGVVINLTQASGPAPPSEAVTAARNGSMIGGYLSGPPSRVTVDRDGTQVGAPPIGEPIEDNAAYNAEYNRHASETDFDPDNPFGSSAPDLPPSMRSKGTRSIPMPISTRSARKLIQSYAGIAIVAAVLLITPLLGVGYYFSQNPFLRGLDLGNKNPDLVSTSDQADEQLSRVVPKPMDVDPLNGGNATPDGEVKNGISKGSPPVFLKPLKKEEIEVKLVHEKYEFATPVATRGGSVKPIFESNRKDPTDAEKKYLEEVELNAIYAWKAVDEKSEPIPIPDSASRILAIPTDSAAHELSLTVTYNEEVWNSDPIRVIDAAKESDFKLKLTDFSINGKEIPFGVPGAKIKAEIEIVNRKEESLEYLGLFIRDSSISWREELNREIGKGIEYNITQENKYKTIKAIVILGDSKIEIQSDLKPVITMLDGRIDFDMNGDKDSRLEVVIQEPSILVKPYQLRLGRQRLIDFFTVDQLISEGDVSENARALRQLDVFADQTTALARSLKEDYSQLVTLARESKGVEINKDFIFKMACLGDGSPREIELALSRKQFDELEAVVVLLIQLIDISNRNGGNYKAEIANRCKPVNPDDPIEVNICRNREKREVRFVEWLKGDELKPRAKTNIYQQSRELHNDLRKIRHSISGLSVGTDLVLTNVKPKLELLMLTQESDPVKIGEIAVPIHLVRNVESKGGPFSSSDSESKIPFDPERIDVPFKP